MRPHGYGAESRTRRDAGNEAGGKRFGYDGVRPLGWWDREATTQVVE
jgi:hypothetical protein